MIAKYIDLNEIKSDKGSLVAIENISDMPNFEIKRVYYIYNTSKNEPRGFHAHKDLTQIAICINGSCNILLDDGKTKRTFKLNKPNKGLVLDKMVWHEMSDFSDDCVFLVLADNIYDESDYIRDYDDFIERVHNASP